jgi:RecA-family ATPase
MAPIKSPDLAALDYLAKGWSVIPICPHDHQKVDGDHEKRCKSPGKAPLWPWQNYQEKPPTEGHVKFFWTKNPNANVGIVMGPVSNLIGVDVDGEEGAKLLHDLCGGHLPNTLEFKTPGASGSRRYLFKYPTKEIHIKSFDAKGKEAIRILAHGSQTVAPPSQHASGGYYEWVPGHNPNEIEPQECPEWLINLANQSHPKKDDQSVAAKPQINGHATPWDRARAYLEKCHPAISGQGGHNQTFKVACKLVKGFDMGYELALTMLKEIYNPRCQPPWTDKELEHKVKSAAELEGPAGYLLEQPKLNGTHKPQPKPEPPPWKVHSRSFKDIEKKKIDWLWRYWIAIGKLTMLDGDPDLGKSTILFDLAARVSKDGIMPDGSQGLTGKVAIMSAEDSAEDTIKARLEVAGADMAKIIELTHTECHGEDRPIEIPKDLKFIEQILGDNQTKLWIIDPLMAFLFGADANKDQEIRRVLHKISQIAERVRCAPIAMRHLNKSNNTKAIYRGNSSIGVIGHARVGLIVGKDPDDENKRILAQQKNNIASKQTSLRYMLDPIGEVCRVAWQGQSKYKADQLLEEPTDEEKETKQEMTTKVVLAKSILTTYLAAGPKPVEECFKECGKLGISKTTTERAKKQLNLALNWTTDPNIGTNIYTWQLPQPNGEGIDGPPENQEAA